MELIKTILDEKEKLDYLDEITNYHNSFMTKREMMAFLEQRLIYMPVTWHILHHDFDERWADLYINKYGYWNHGGSKDRMIAHNRHGMAFAWWAKELSGIFAEFKLHDSPDFSGVLNSDIPYKNRIGHKVYGDIGQCTGTPFIDLLIHQISVHDIWISSFQGEKIVLEFGYNGWGLRNCMDIAQKNNLTLNDFIEKNKSNHEIVNELFMCASCKKMEVNFQN